MQKPALILVDEAAGDPQLSYVINDPEFSNDVLVARLPQDDAGIDELRSAFPAHNFYRFNPRAFVLESFQ